MGLETGNFISALNSNNPVGASDPKSQGDDHIRFTKAKILQTFPNITGAVTATHTEINYTVGLTGTTGTGKMVRDAAPTFTGVVTFDDLSGDDITADDINADAITANTVAATHSGNGAALTSLNASNISSGTLADARHSSNIPLINAALNTFTGTAAWGTAQATTKVSVKFGTTDTLLGLHNTDTGSGSNIFLNASNTSNTDCRLVITEPSAGTQQATFGPSTNSDLVLVTQDTARLRVTGGGLVKVTAEAAEREIGFRRGEPIDVAASSAFSQVHVGRVVHASSAGTFTVNSGIFAKGDFIIFYNIQGANCTIAQGAGVAIRKAGQAGVNGNCTVSDHGMAFIYFESSTVCMCGGPGVT